MKSNHKPHLHQDWIDRDALSIVKILQKKGFETYLVGGCVRDLLVGIPPKDFDIATNALPQDVKRAVPGSYIIGKRFRLVLAKRGPKQFEIATFRRNFSEDEFPEGVPFGDNVFGTCEEDAQRRDFSLNALFYDPIGDELKDFSTGLKDIEKRLVCMIGDPVERLKEDPIRILRALRLSHKTQFSIEPELREAIVETAETLPTTVLPRRREEILKFLRLKEPHITFQEAYDLDVLKHLSPTLNEVYEEETARETFSEYLRRLPLLVHNKDNPIELFAILLLAFLRAKNDSSEAKLGRILKSEESVAFLKTELGLFKHEQSVIIKALQIMQTLSQAEDFKRKGERRKLALLRNEAFPIALQLAESDYLLSAEDLGFWHDVYASHLPRIEEYRQQLDSKKKTRKRSPRYKKSEARTGA